MRTWRREVARTRRQGRDEEDDKVTRTWRCEDKEEDEAARTRQGEGRGGNDDKEEDKAARMWTRQGGRRGPPCRVATGSLSFVESVKEM